MKRAIFAVDFYPPGFQAGGPPHSVSLLANALRDVIDITVVTRNRDRLDRRTYVGLRTEVATRHRGVKVIYLRRPSLRRLHRIVSEIQPDILYCGSLFSRFTICFLVLCRFCFREVSVVVTPRGELGRGALRIKRLKKHIYLMVTRAMGMYDQTLFHVTSDFERRDTEKWFEGRIRVIENLTDRERFARVVPADKERGILKIVYISKIDRKKNLRYALQVLKMVEYSGKIAMGIYGPINDRRYWRECRKEINAMPETVSVTYHGEVRPSDVPSVLGQHHVLFLPTTNENFGHVIIEALSAGLPVLISDQTPWSNLQEIGVGWSLPLGKPDGFAGVIEDMLSMGAERFRVISDRARTWERDRIGKTRIIDAYKEMFGVNYAELATVKSDT